MIPCSQSEKYFSSARRRFLAASIQRFLDQQFPRTFGPVISCKIAEELVELLNRQLPAKDHLRPGQCLWNAVSIRTRPDSPQCQMVPVILTLVDPEDVEELAQGTPMPRIAQKALARISREAFQQGALLSMRDIGLLVWRKINLVTPIRQAWERRNQTVLPHTGSLQDFGSCISHKTAIIHKVVYEGKDPRRVCDETKHSQRAVDRYLKDFYRVKTCYEHKPEVDFITQTTGLSRHLVKQYVRIISEHENRT